MSPGEGEGGGGGGAAVNFRKRSKRRSNAAVKLDQPHDDYYYQSSSSSSSSSASNYENMKKKKRIKKKKGGSHVQKGRSKRCELMSYWELPEYMKDNEFILNYYRADWPVLEALFSVFRWHNETLNVWTYVMIDSSFLIYIYIFRFCYMG